MTAPLRLKVAGRFGPFALAAALLGLTANGNSTTGRDTSRADSLLGCSMFVYEEEFPIPSSSAAKDISAFKGAAISAGLHLRNHFPDLTGGLADSSESNTLLFARFKTGEMQIEYRVSRASQGEITTVTLRLQSAVDLGPGSAHHAIDGFANHARRAIDLPEGSAAEAYSELQNPETLREYCVRYSRKFGRPPRLAHQSEVVEIFGQPESIESNRAGKSGDIPRHVGAAFPYALARKGLFRNSSVPGVAFPRHLN